MVAYPDESALSDAVASAFAAAEPILVAGAGTKSAMLRPVQAARSLSARELTGITLYAPKELVLSARAGTRVRDIDALLAENGQHLIAEPPDYAALLGTEPGTQTIGGITATNLSGPRRIAWGAMRDHVLGLRAIDGTGAVMRSGGRVLKNVTGLDMCKLLTGSHGTLAVITEVTLKVLPAPESSGSLLLPGLDPVRAVAALAAALGSPYGVSGAAYLPPDAAARLGWGGAGALVRIEDFAASVSYRLGRLREDLAAFAPAELLDRETSQAAWRAIRDAAVLPAEPTDAIWRISVRPSQGPTILAATPTTRGYLDWGGGLVLLAGPATEAAHAAITAATKQAGGVWTLLRAPDSLRAAVDVVPPEPPALTKITRRVKATMDPKGILNPGRIYAGM
jgi:glycolate oxidase FAD binding subunit